MQIIGMEPQTGSKDDNKGFASGCGSIDLHGGGLSGPTDMGGAWFVHVYAGIASCLSAMAEVDEDA